MQYRFVYAKIKEQIIGVGVTAVVAIAVAVTGGAAAAAIPVLIGAGMGASVGTGISVVTGIAQGKTAAEIAGDASDAFMWGAIGEAFSGGTGSLLQSAGKSAASSFVRNNLIESGIDTVVDLTQTGITNGKITTKDVLFSVEQM